MSSTEAEIDRRCSTPSPTPPAATSCAAAADGEHSVSRLADGYPMSFAAVQKHVAVLERAGLVTKRATAASSSCGPIDAVARARRVLDAAGGAGASRVDRDGRASPNPEHRRRTPMTVTDIDKDPTALTITSSPSSSAGRTGLAAVGRPAQARALVGSADLPGDLRRPRPAPAARSATS